MSETKNMTVSVSFPGIDKRPAPVRSLANFIMENSSLYFKKEVVDDQERLIGNVLPDVITDSNSLLYIKYTDPKNENFPQSERHGLPSYASYQYLNSWVATAATPGSNGNNYKFRLYEDSQAYFVVEVYEQVSENQFEMISSGRTTTSSVFITYNMYKANHINDIELSNGEDLSDYISFSVTDLNYSSTSLPIEFQLSGGSDDDGKDYDIINGYDGIVDCNTVLCKANTKVDLASYIHSGDKGYLSKLENFVNIPVTITPKIGKAVNADPSVSLIFEDDASAAKFNLSSNKAGNYDTQLRTTSFTLAIVNYESEQERLRKDVFYKVGVCPLDGSEKTRDEIVRDLKYHCFSSGKSSSGIPTGEPIDISPKDGDSVAITVPSLFDLLSPMWQIPQYTLSSNLSGAAVFNQDYNNFEDVPVSMCTTLYCNGEIAGLIYFRLYNEDGSLFTDEIDLENEGIVIYTKEDKNADAVLYTDGYLYLPLRDYNLDSGFIKTPIIEYSPGPVSPGGGKDGGK